MAGESAKKAANKKQAKRTVTKEIVVKLTGEPRHVERTLDLLREICDKLQHVDRQQPSTGESPAPKEKPRDARALWIALTSNQRELLHFVWQRENGHLTIEEIAGNSMFFLKTPLKMRHMSDKSVRKCANALFENGLMTRDGPRSGIFLTALGHEVHDWGRANDTRSASG